MNDFPETRSTLLANVRSPENREAWQEFELLYRPVIYRMARARGMQDADAQDLAQTVLVNVSLAIGRYEKKQGIRFRHWLKRVAKNAILTALTRSPKDLADGGSGIWDQVTEQLQWSPDAEQELSLEAMREIYLRAAARVRIDVSTDTWQAFELTALQGKSCDEAAELIGKSVGTVYAARSRIVYRLRQQVTKLQQVADLEGADLERSDLEGTDQEHTDTKNDIKSSEQ